MIISGVYLTDANTGIPVGNVTYATRKDTINVRFHAGNALPAIKDARTL